MKLVHVKWQDNATDARWGSRGSVRPTRCESVGWLVGKTKKTITVAASRNDEGHVGDRTVILRPCITSVRVIK